MNTSVNMSSTATTQTASRTNHVQIIRAGNFRPTIGSDRIGSLFHPAKSPLRPVPSETSTDNQAASVPQKSLSEKHPPQPTASSSSLLCTLHLKQIQSKFQRRPHNESLFFFNSSPSPTPGGATRHAPVPRLHRRQMQETAGVPLDRHRARSLVNFKL